MANSAKRFAPAPHPLTVAIPAGPSKVAAIWQLDAPWGSADPQEELCPPVAKAHRICPEAYHWLQGESFGRWQKFATSMRYSRSGNMSARFSWQRNHRAANDDHLTLALTHMRNNDAPNHDTIATTLQAIFECRKNDANFKPDEAAYVEPCAHSARLQRGRG